MVGKLPIDSIDQIIYILNSMARTQLDKHCVVCEQWMSGGVQSWHMVCKHCGYESGALDPAINEHETHQAIDEEDREAGLKTLRLENFREVLKLIESCASPGAQSLLDVGSAHGWFLELARKRFAVLGVEPDITVGSKTAALGMPIRAGYFPQALCPGEAFDVIVFNDVIEHIPDLRNAIAACHGYLRDGGILVLNLPSSRGMFYRLSKILASLGWTGPFERMWQKGFPSPHVHFFHHRNLARVICKNGFSQVKHIELPSVRIKGLLQRIRYANNVSILNFYLQFLGTLFMLPWIRIFPSDVIVCVYRKK